MEVIPNIAVKSNVWCNPKQLDTGGAPYFLEPILPGDLLVHFLGTRDTRTLQAHLTLRQREEYEQSRFFQQHGQEGIAFDRLDP